MSSKCNDTAIHRVGIISDTHGFLRMSVLEVFRPVELIIHAGDVGDLRILTTLQAIAPVVAVRGNTDRTAGLRKLPETDVVEIRQKLFYVLHDVNNLDVDPAGAGFSAIISGHTHRPYAETKEGVLFLNPGSAGPRRFRLPISVALITLQGKSLDTQIIELSE